MREGGPLAVDEYAFASGKYRRFTAIILFSNAPTNQNYGYRLKAGKHYMLKIKLLNGSLSNCLKFMDYICSVTTKQSLACHPERRLETRRKPKSKPVGRPQSGRISHPQIKDTVVFKA